MFEYFTVIETLTLNDIFIYSIDYKSELFHHTFIFNLMFSYLIVWLLRPKIKN